MPRALSRLRREGIDALELVLLPGLAAVLPWTLCFRLFRRMAHWGWLYRAAAEADWAQAHARGLAPQRQRWLWERKLVQLVDHADLYLHKMRPDAWLHRHVRVHGDWREGGRPAFLFTFHWGAGLWGLRHAAQAGLAVHALAAPVPEDAWRGRWVLRHYARARLRAVQQALGQAVIYVPRDLRQVRRALGDGEQVLALLDVPQDGAGRPVACELLGERIGLSLAMPELAARQQAPAVLYVTGLDVDTGQRWLRINALPAGLDADGLAHVMLQSLDALIRERPAAWHLWAQWPRFVGPVQERGKHA